MRSADRFSVLLDLARVLHIEVEALTDRVPQRASKGPATGVDLGGLRRFFSQYDHMLDLENVEPVDLVSVRAQVAAAHRAYQAARYEETIALLPGLLATADACRSQSPPHNRRERLLSYVSAYVLAAKLLTKLGEADLALLASDRCSTAAAEADSLAARGMAGFQVVCALLRAGRAEEAESLAVTMAERVSRKACPELPVLVSVAGSLWLIAAVTAARRADRSEAWRHLEAAEDLATMLGKNANLGWTAFGPTNVAIHRVSVAAQLGDAAEALRAAPAADAGRLAEGLVSRRVQVQLDLAWAHVQRRRDADALLHLLEVERVAPQAVRYNVAVRELIREMLARSRRTRTNALHNLAVRAGTLD